jgi:Ala-tRNA(Pro) deacylase
MDAETGAALAGREALFARLAALAIETTTYEHEAVYTVEQARKVHALVPGVHCKNLFLKDAKGQIWLVVVPADRIVDLKGLPDRIGAKRLSFGQPPLLMEVLGVEPGSVTPFALINDTQRRVKVVLDRWMMEQPLLNFHPLVNTASTCIAAADLERFIRDCGHAPAVVDLGGAPAAPG